MILYKEPAVFGFALFASKVGNKFRIEMDPVQSLHYHYGKSKKKRKPHKGAWIAGIVIGIYAGFTGEVY